MRSLGTKVVILSEILTFISQMKGENLLQQNLQQRPTNGCRIAVVSHFTQGNYVDPNCHIARLCTENITVFYNYYYNVKFTIDIQCPKNIHILDAHKSHRNRYRIIEFCDDVLE